MIQNNLKKRILTSLFLVMIILLIFLSKLSLIFFLICFGILSIVEFSSITKKIFKKRTTYFTSNFFFIIYIFFFTLLFFHLSNFLETKTLLFLILITCIASDVGGYTFGKLIKGPKLTKISPNKTYAGAIGSLIFSCFFFSLSILQLIDFISINIIFIALIISASCQIGDLFFSYLKRKAGIKHTGNFLPGHGGILDRLDSILLGMPFGLTSTILLI